MLNRLDADGRVESPNDLMSNCSNFNALFRNSFVLQNMTPLLLTLLRRYLRLAKATSVLFLFSTMSSYQTSFRQMSRASSAPRQVVLLVKQSARM